MVPFKRTYFKGHSRSSKVESERRKVKFWNNSNNSKKWKSLYQIIEKRLSSMKGHWRSKNFDLLNLNLFKMRQIGFQNEVFDVSFFVLWKNFAQNCAQINSTILTPTLSEFPDFDQNHFLILWCFGSNSN